MKMFLFASCSHPATSFRLRSNIYPENFIEKLNLWILLPVSCLTAAAWNCASHLRKHAYNCSMSLLISSETFPWRLIINKNTRSWENGLSCGWVVDEVKDSRSASHDFSSRYQCFIVDSGYLWLHLISILTWSEPLITLMRQQRDRVAVGEFGVMITSSKSG